MQFNPLCPKCYSKDIIFNKLGYDNKYSIDCNDCGTQIDIVTKDHITCSENIFSLHEN